MNLWPVSAKWTLTTTVSEAQGNIYEGRYDSQPIPVFFFSFFSFLSLRSILVHLDFLMFLIDLFFCLIFFRCLFFNVFTLVYFKPFKQTVGKVDKIKIDQANVECCVYYFLRYMIKIISSKLLSSFMSAIHVSFKFPTKIPFFIYKIFLNIRSDIKKIFIYWFCIESLY